MSGLFDFDLSTADRITKAKVRLQSESPFFAHLLMNMLIKEDKRVPSMGVNFKGNAVYNEEWLSEKTDQEIKAVLCHEVMHVALMHLVRLGKRDQMLWNIAADCCINWMLNREGFKLPKEGIIPSSYGEVELPFKSGKKKINVSNKSAEEVYDMLQDLVDKEGDLEGTQGFDQHEFGENLSEAEAEDIRREWTNKLVEAATAAKARGKLPGSVERFLDELMNPQLNWKAMMYQFITKDIIHNYTMARPSKRSYSTGVFMPHALKENLTVVVTVDTSGSISKEEYSVFFGEICGIANAFENVDIELVFWDTEVRKTVKLRGKSKEELMKIKPYGGGGTHMSCLGEYFQGKPVPRLMVHLTDGCIESDPEIPQNCKHLFVVSGRWGHVDIVKDYGTVCRILND